ncbi:MAG: SDR family oxidoreductase [Hyalangium sp.]|uniref:SDR family oxidoreductase n=1 Tax=Hyalangium sp. TaxID=2028555 RepID=UPI003899DBD5
MRVLILGIAGGIARKLATRLLDAGHEVLGIDVRPWSSAPHGIELHRVDVRKRAAEDVFRRRRPDAVVHMATVTALTVSGGERGRINLDGTKAVFDHCRAYGVKQAVFVGRHTFYGAAADSPLYHSEDEPPRALENVPELADLVAADLYAATALWRMPEVTTTVLRLVYTLGSPGTGTLASFLRGRRVPMVLGYDPLFQVMQEEDVVTAIQLALEKRIRGIFNVAGPPPVPFSIIIRETGRTPVPLPGPVLERLLGRFGFPALSKGSLAHIKYPIVVDNARFREATGFRYDNDEGRILRIFREASPPPGSQG